jgi:tricorn protease
MGKYFTISIDGGFEVPLQIPEGGGGMLSPDGSKMVYTPIEREWRTWKRYRGGRAQDIWIYDLINNTTEKITDYIGTDNQPMWVGNKIYFTSDRTGTLNLYSYDLSSKQTETVTTFDDYDVIWPSAGENKIVYENGGYIYKYDPSTNKNELVPIKVFGDFPGTIPYTKNVKNNANWFEISPTGKRALLGARGDVFTIPVENGEINNITQTPGIREIDPVWSPDGKWIAYLSDRTGEYELFTKSSDGKGEENQITADGTIWRFEPVWSPDSKKLAFSDKNQKLWYVDVNDGNTIEVDHSDFNDITDYQWSPDSRWLTYTKGSGSQMSSIWVYSLDTKATTQLTSDLTSEFNPVFSKDGKYLYFFSNRDFNLKFSSWEFNYVYTNPTRVYAAALNNNVSALFQPKSDDEIVNGEDNKKTDTGEVVIKIDPENFENRIVVLPGSSGNYSSLRPTENGVLYIYRDDAGSKLKYFNAKDEKEVTVLEGVGNYAVSEDGKKLIYSMRGEYGIVDVKENQKNTDGRLDLSKLEMKIYPKEEWAEMYVDAWRLLRDWFYDSNMHGLDWDKMKEKYGQLVPYVATRMDLDYIFGELGGELSAGHVYVDWGDFERVERKEGGLLGCELEADPSGYYKIKKIFKGENWHSDFRSPLTEYGVNVNVGDYIIAIDGQEVKTNENPYKYLENKANVIVTLFVNNKPSKDEAREEKVKPITNEGNLRYLDWVNSRMKMVDELSGGRIGYIHIPNTAVEGNRELFKYFYPQTNKEALIIDDRYNGGGFVPDRMIELLDRQILNYWVRRGIEPVPVPGIVNEGPKACLINGYSSSGGDAFPYYFRERKMGTLIGTRTWGGLIGISGNPALMDGGSISIPVFRFLDTDGNWAVENEGVYPDIEVIDRADLVVQGRDPSLEKAVEVLLEELKNKPPKKIVVPPAPDESKK